MYLYFSLRQGIIPHHDSNGNPIYRVSLGNHQLGIPKKGVKENVYVEKFIVHRDWRFNPNKLTPHDIALVKLKKRVTQTRYIKVRCFCFLCFISLKRVVYI